MGSRGRLFEKLWITLSLRTRDRNQAFSEFGCVGVKPIQFSIGVNGLFVIGKSNRRISPKQFIRQCVEETHTRAGGLATMKPRLFHIAVQFISTCQVRKEFLSDLARLEIVF